MSKQLRQHEENKTFLKTMQGSNVGYFDLPPKLTCTNHDERGMLRGIEVPCHCRFNANATINNALPLAKSGKAGGVSQRIGSHAPKV